MFLHTFIGISKIKLSLAYFTQSFLEQQKDFMPDMSAFGFIGVFWAKALRVNVGTFGQCRYNRTLLYFLDNFSGTSGVIALCNPEKSQ